MNLLITCPPMINRISQYDYQLKDFNVFIPEFQQIVSEERLIDLVPKFDYWIIGDDPATRRVIESGYKGKLKTIIKWGIGIDNIDLDAIKEYNINFSNTPDMFGDEVADVAIGYLLAMTRELYKIDKSVRSFNWYKPSGISIKGKKTALIGFGNIGRSIADRLLVLGCDLYVYDPGFYTDYTENNQIKCKYNLNLNLDKYDTIKLVSIEECLNNARIVILSCPLNQHTKNLINLDKLNLLQDKSYLINVSRGPIVNESDVYKCLESGKLSGFASDVFIEEPINEKNLFINHPNTILGTHNASNTVEAVDRTSIKTIELIKKFI